jgi:hypothetical protein
MYRVDDGPNNTVPPFAWGTGYDLDPLRYWGVFVDNVFSNSPTYTLLYDWTLHQGIAEDSFNTMKLAYRSGNCDKPWKDLGATLDTVNRTLTQSTLSGTEYILGGNIDANDPLAITLASFTAKVVDGCIEIFWETATEIGTLGFELWRSTEKDGEYTLVPNSYTRSEAVMESMGAVYSFKDCDAVPDGKIAYYYKLREIDLDNTKDDPFYGPIGPVPDTVTAAQPAAAKDSRDKACFISILSE